MGVKRKTLKNACLRACLGQDGLPGQVDQSLSGLPNAFQPLGMRSGQPGTVSRGQRIQLGAGVDFLQGQAVVQNAVARDFFEKAHGVRHR